MLIHFTESLAKFTHGGIHACDLGIKVLHRLRFLRIGREEFVNADVGAMRISKPNDGKERLVRLCHFSDPSEGDLHGGERAFSLHLDDLAVVTE